MAVLAAGCQSANFELACEALPLAAYTAEMQARAVDELAAMPGGAALPVLIEDYGALRARVRAICGTERV